MAQSKPQSIVFDFTGLDVEKPNDIVWNISGVAVAGDRIWTVSDEDRTLQCFAPRGKDYALKKSFELKELVNLPKFKKSRMPPGRKQKKEADLEGLAFDGKYLWFCGSHCRARSKPKDGGTPDTFIEDAQRRHVLGRIKLNTDGSWDGEKGQILSVTGNHTLRRLLAKNEMIAPYLDLPAKENGLDIEGIAVARGRLLVGLRGPVIAGRAIILTLRINRDFELISVAPQFIDLAGLGVRDLLWDGRRLLVLAGPTLPCDAPYFVLHEQAKKWKSALPQLPSKPDDHPEAIGLLRRNGRRGLLMLADGKVRAKGLRYTADWYPL